MYYTSADCTHSKEITKFIFSFNLCCVQSWFLVHRNIFSWEKKKSWTQRIQVNRALTDTHTHTSWPLDPVSCHTRWYLGQGLLGRWQPVISLCSAEHAQGTFSASPSHLGLTYILHTASSGLREVKTNGLLTLKPSTDRCTFVCKSFLYHFQNHIKGFSQPSCLWPFVLKRLFCLSDIQMCAVLAALNCINYITRFCLSVLVGL